MTLLSEEVLGAIGRSESFGPVTVSRNDISKYSIGTGQRHPGFLNGDLAPPLYFWALPWRLDEISELAEDGLQRDELIPDFPLSQRMGGGMRVESTRAIVPGDVLCARRVLCEIYEKAGRAGPLIFHVCRWDISDATGAVIIRAFDKRIIR